jgi:hypothetical protein
MRLQVLERIFSTIPAVLFIYHIVVLIVCGVFGQWACFGWVLLNLVSSIFIMALAGDSKEILADIKSTFGLIAYSALIGFMTLCSLLFLSPFVMMLCVLAALCCG